MRRKLWLVLAVAALVAVSFAASVVSAKRVSDARPRTVTRGLDFLHSHQAENGGFKTAPNTLWAVLGAVASGERMGSKAWTVSGHDPFDYLQSVDHKVTAGGGLVDNAPVYYARAIMAYVALGQRERVFVAGTPKVDLLAQLYTYQDTTTGSATEGSFSPSSSMRTFDAVHTTSWAVLAMHAFGLDSDARYAAAIAWLAGQAGESGGFPSEPGKTADVLDTALAVQALAGAPEGQVDAAVLAAARQYLKDAQNANAGFPVSPGGPTDAEATSATIQAIIALGEDPDGEPWRSGGKTPAVALGALQQVDGSYSSSARSSAGSVPTTGWALVALRHRSFVTFPRDTGAATRAFLYRPEFKTVSPKNKAKFTHTRVVLVRATYTDFAPKGTGIKPKACRLYIDDVDRSRPAKIGRYGLRLLLKDVPNGSHTYRILLRDEAGNEHELERTFIVNVQTPPVVPTNTPTPIYPTHYPTPTYTPTPYETKTPTPYPTPTEYPSYSPYPTESPSGMPVTGSPVPSPSTSASPGASSGGGGGSAAGFVGGTLLAMLPIGAAISYLALQRREEILGSASQGALLAGGGSSWDRFKAALAKSKDLTRPVPKD